MSSLKFNQKELELDLERMELYNDLKRLWDQDKITTEEYLRKKVRYLELLELKYLYESF